MPPATRAASTATCSRLSRPVLASPCSHEKRPRQRRPTRPRNRPGAAHQPGTPWSRSRRERIAASVRSGPAAACAAAERTARHRQGDAGVSLCPFHSGKRRRGGCARRSVRRHRCKWTGDRARQRHLSSGRLRRRGEIIVENTREIGHFLRLTPAEGGWRVVIVDGADEMNRNAANALLKILEEPPRRTLLLLAAHSPGRLLPTIRSRCRRFPLAPLPPAIVRELLLRYRPDLPEPQAEALTALSAGSIGRALDLAAAGGVELYESVLALLSRDQGIDPAALHAFADRLARGEAEEAYRAVEELVAQLLARVAGAATRRTNGAVLPHESAVLQRLGNRAPAARWAELRDEIGRLFARTDALNLDKKQTILSAFFAIEGAAR